MRKAVVVDDEGYARKGLIGLVPWAKLGFEVVGEAEDGEDAYAFIDEHRPDVVITDIRMPVMDGLELIRQVRESGNRETRFIIISGYGDFKYAQQAVRYGVEDYLLKPIDENELAGTLERIAAASDSVHARKEAEERLIRASAFERLLTGRADETFPAEAARILGLPLGKPLRCVTVEINDARTGASETHDAEQLESARLALCEAVAAATDGRTPELFVRSLTEMNFLLFGELGADRVRRLGERLVRAAGSPAGGVPRVYAGAVVPGLGQAGESYASAADLTRFKYALDRSVLVHEDAAGQTVAYREWDAALLSELIETLEERDEEKMTQSVNRLFEKFREQRFSPDSVQASINRCVHRICGVIQTMKGDEGAIASLPRLLRGHREPRTLNGLKYLLLTFLKECADYMSELRSAMTKGDIGKIKHYIDSHFSENLNLKSISKTFYMNPVYLGQLFKKTYGVYFNEYLLQIRIAEAKRQLRQTDRKVYEIAASVGFGNADYFVCQFEKVEGRTPTEYKNAILEKA
ncbi:response regulator [Cohnella hongkongensis]|uniref:Response regulator n=1 Tax=Cohnella hongkongensis TaxID=178337 RepID=A0ABV9FC01_9BACL